MSWNLLIYSLESEDVMRPLGSLATVTNALNTAFPSLEWRSVTECRLKMHRGFYVDLTIKDQVVSEAYTNGGYDHLKELPGMCKQHGWRIADAQKGEDIDLDDPYSLYAKKKTE